MREIRMSGSVGAPGEQSPGATRLDWRGLQERTPAARADLRARRAVIGGGVRGAAVRLKTPDLVGGERFMREDREAGK
jgi:hypothetical protein